MLSMLLLLPLLNSHSSHFLSHHCFFSFIILYVLISMLSMLLLLPLLNSHSSHFLSHHCFSPSLYSMF
jgi:hypothetical protein